MPFKTRTPEDRLRLYRVVRRWRNRGIVVTREVTYANPAPWVLTRGRIIPVLTYCAPTVPTIPATITRSTMSAQVRQTIALVRDYEARQRNAQSLVKLAAAEKHRNLSRGLSEPHSPVRGIPAIPTVDVRVSERGASGIPGVRGTFAQVSMRDAQSHGDADAILLRGMATVGCATHPSATGDDYSRVLRDMRIDPTLCTVCVRQSHASYSTWDRGEHVTILPVWGYVESARIARKARRTSKAGDVSVTRDHALQAAMGTIHSEAA